MTNTRFRGTVLIATLALVLGTAGVVAGPRAEVSAEVDVEGRYVRTIILSRISINHVSIWTPTIARSTHVPLNPLGDMNGDMWPVVVEDPGNGNAPWIVWSRFNGSDYDLAWSRWSNRAWEQVRWVQDTPCAGDDVDPDMTLDSAGRPHIAWWSDAGGQGAVHFSMFLDTRWMTAYQISDEGVDSRYPEIHANDDGSFTVNFETANGPDSRTIRFVEGVSINDDAEPIGALTVERFGQ